MFLKSRRWYAGTEQRAAGRFLMIFSRPKSKELRVLVRRVEMRQCGHFMMSSVKVECLAAKAAEDTVSRFDKERHPHFYRVGDGHYKISLSGTYGGDGLPIDSDYYPGLWERLHLLPDILTNKFWAGGGHNSAGAEATYIHAWANELVGELTRLKKGD